MDKTTIYIFAGAIGFFCIVFVVSNLYWGTFLIILAQPFFVQNVQGEMGISPKKLVYGILFAAWMLTWLMSKIFQKSSQKTVMWHPMAAPALAFWGVLCLAVLMGLIYGASPGDIFRDLSQYVGYLAVLVVIDKVRTPSQAKKLLLFLAILGLPSSLFYDLNLVNLKQGMDVYPEFNFAPYGAPYWGPIQGMIWALALSSASVLHMALAWVWLMVSSAIKITSGVRSMLISLLVAGTVAFIGAGRLGRSNISRYLVPVFLVLVVGGVAADLSGAINLPFSRLTRQSYTSLTSEKNLLADRSLQGRMVEFTAQIQAFARNPLTGIGLGHSLKYPGAGKDRIRFTYHNGYGETFYKFGIFGTFIFGWFFWRITRMSYGIMRTRKSYLSQLAGLGTLVWLLTSFVLSFVYFSQFSNRGFALTVGLMAGLLPALANQHPLGQEPQRIDTNAQELSR